LTGRASAPSMKARPLVLVIEDSEDVRMICAVLLRLEGFAVEEATNGADGLRKATHSIPDVIITDLTMPVMDGWETIRRLRADERTRHIPIIACSGEKAPTDPRPDAHLVKPCPPETLLLELRRVLRDAT
jgi:chemosensory pili system protein ChpA (sensor histidine kinase/response regulator)